MSQKNAVAVAKGRNVLMMNSPADSCGRSAMARVEEIKSIAADCLYFEFHDIFGPRPGLIHPQFHHVKQTLEWGKDKDPEDTIYVCQAGISRSSAMAYILNAAKKGPHEAIKVLNHAVHMPNRLIVAMGADLLAGRKGHEITKVSEQNHPVSPALTWGCEWSSKPRYARQIMEVYLNYITEVEAMHSAEVPLEIIEHAGQEIESGIMPVVVKEVSFQGPVIVPKYPPGA